MHKSVFHIAKMDCAAEEQMIRMQLESVQHIEQLTFDLPGRALTVYHHGEIEPISKALAELRLGDRLLSTEITATIQSDTRQVQRRTLWTVLVINFGFFVIEMTTGLISWSMGLVADSLDMLADSVVYGLSLLAVGGTMALKKRIATLAGYFQMLLAILGFGEVVRRFLSSTTLPDFKTMIVVSTLALIANTVCLYLLRRSRSKEAHMQASMIFTSNDILINLGVIVAGVLVLWTSSGIPDLVVGSVVFVLVIRGALRILKLGR